MLFLDIISRIANDAEDDLFDEPVAPFTQDCAAVTSSLELDPTLGVTDDADGIEYDDLSSTAANGLRRTRSEAGLNILDAEYSEPMKKRIREFVDKVASEIASLTRKTLSRSLQW